MKYPGRLCIQGWNNVSDKMLPFTYFIVPFSFFHIYIFFKHKIFKRTNFMLFSAKSLHRFKTIVGANICSFLYILWYVACYR